jgi:hypothetical protein
MPDGSYFLKITYRDDKTGEIKTSRTLQSEVSIKNRGDYIDRFEELQAEKHQYQNLSKPQTMRSDSGKIHAHRDTTYQEPGTAFFVELLGKPWTSINVDFRINKSSRFSLGIAYYYYYEGEDEEQEEIVVSSFIPNIVYYYLRGEKNKKFEIGAGLGVTPVWHKDYNFDSPIFFHSVIGYRYQKKDGLLFRIGLTFNKYDDLGLFFLGISFGHSF